MPVLPQLGPAPGTALSRRGPPPASASSTHGNTQDEEKMKIAEEETDQKSKSHERVRTEGASSSPKEHEPKELGTQTKKPKQIRFVEPLKDETSSSEGTSEEETGAENVIKNVKKVESSKEETESSSEDSESPERESSESSVEESDSSRDNKQVPVKLVTLAVHQEVPKSLKPPPITRENVSSSSEEEVTSSEEAEDDKKESTEYTVLRESHSEERLQTGASEVKEVIKPSEEEVSSSTTETKQEGRAKQKRERHRIFEKVPNQNAVYVPLHGSSDADETEEDSKETTSKTTETNPSTEQEGINAPKHSGKWPLKRQYAEAPNEYSILVPLRGRASDHQAVDEETEKKTDEAQSPIIHPEKEEAEKIESLKTDEHAETITKAEEELVEIHMARRKSKPRMFFKVPNQDAVVIPLHGSSDEEVENDETIDIGDRSAKTFDTARDSPTEEEEPSKYAVIVSLHKSPFEKETIAEEAVLHSIEKVQDINESVEQSIQNEQENEKTKYQKTQEEKPKKVKHRIFTKVPGENAVFVPLHGSSDDEETAIEAVKDSVNSDLISPEDYTTGQAAVSSECKTIYAEPANKYSVLVPLHGLPGEQEVIIDEREDNKEVKQDEKEIIETTPLEEKNIKGVDDEITIAKPVVRKQRLFMKVPNQNAVVIPLHGSSDEDDSVDIDEDDGLRTPPPAEKHLHQERKSSKALVQREVVYDSAPNEYGIIVPLAGFPNEKEEIEEKNSTDPSNAIISTGVESEKLIQEESSKAEEKSAEADKTIKKKQRVFLKVPNQNAVFVPLHGSSDEEEVSTLPDENRERSESICETPKITTLQRIYSGAPNEYAIFVPLSPSPEELRSSGDNERQVETSKPETIPDQNTKEAGISNQSESLRETVIEKPKKPKPKLFFKVPNQDSVIVPLHSSSDDESRQIVDDDDGLIQSVSRTPEPMLTKNIDNSASNEYGIIVPLHGLPKELEIPIAEEAIEDKTETVGEPGTELRTEKPEDQEPDKPTPDTIHDGKGSEKKIKKKQRIFVKVPNQDAVIVPLHGSSDEEGNEDIAPSAESSQLPRDVEHVTDDAGEGDVKIIYEQAPNEYRILVPLQRLPDEDRFELETLSTSEQVGTSILIAGDKVGHEEMLASEVELSDAKYSKEVEKPKKRKSRLFYKIPNQNAFLVPLHGSSDEEEVEAKGEDSGSIGVLEPGLSPPVAEEPHQERKFEYEEAPNEYGIIVPLHKFPYEPKTYEEEKEKPLPLVSPHGPESSDKQTKTTTTKRDTEEENTVNEVSKSVKKKQRVFMKVPNQDAVYVPLHGSSDEEEGGIRNEEVLEPNASVIAESLSRADELGKSAEEIVKEETGTKEAEKPKAQYVGAPNEYAIFVPLHGLPDEDKIEEIPEQKKQTDQSENRGDIPSKDNGEITNSLVWESKPTVDIQTTTTTSITFDNKEKEAVSKEAPTNKKETKPKKRRIKTPTKELSLEKPSEVVKSKTTETAKTKPAEKSLDQSEQIDKPPPAVKEKVTIKKTASPFKMADVVLQMMTKKEVEDKGSGAVSSTGKEGTTDLPNDKQQDKGDHEYEPIQPPRSASQPPDSRGYVAEPKGLPTEAASRPVEVKSTDTRKNIVESRGQPLEARAHPVEVNVKREEEDRYEIVRPQEQAILQEVTPALQAEGGYEIVEEPKKQEPKRYIRIPNEDAIIVPLHGSSDEEINPDRYLNPALMMSEEEIESLPHKMSYNQTQTEVPKEHTKTHDATIQERLKTQADRFTTKLRGISKPNIIMNRPNIKLPERPNIKMPEMPKIKLPDRPKFSFPDTSKFHLPERPKLHLPDRSKFHLPEKPKFLTERPKFKLPDRPKFSRGEKKPKAPKGKKPNPSSLRRPLRDVVTISSQSTPGSTHNIFETLKFRTYPRFFKKKKTPIVQKMSSLETESSQPSTPPMRPRSYSGQQQDTSWVHAYRDVKFADEDSNLRVERMEEEYEKEENSAPFHEHYDGGVRAMVERELKQGKAESMTSVVSEKGSSGSSSRNRRAGVIEEIDSDEFFLREKGLSREDVDVSRYLSLEIRDAFRQPKNALASLDSELYDDDEPEPKFEHSPRAPQRSKPRKAESFEQEQEFHTFPKRPSRRKESDPEIVVKPPRRFRSSSAKSGSRYRGRQSSMPSLNSDMEVVPPEPPRRQSRDRSIKSLNREGQVSYHGDEIVQNRESAQHSVEIPPVAPLRKSRSRGTSLADDDRTSRGADSTILPDDDDLHQPNQEEREELEEEMMEEEEEEEVEVEIKEEPYKEVESVTTQDTLKIEERSVDYSGYAVVAKGRKKPPRPPPPPQPHFHFQSQLDSIRNTGKQIFFTYPRRAIKSLNKQPPPRPMRNYSTLGPVRPPRRNRVFRQPLYMTGDSQPQQETLVDKERDLQSGDVVNRMKGRPLPPPPRPPRKTKDLDSFLESEKSETIPTETIVEKLEIEEELEPEIKEDRLSYLESKKDKFFGTFSKFSPFSRDDQEEKVKEETIQTEGEKQTSIAQQTSFEFGEVSVSIQTDPLPKDVIVIDQEIEETEEILILPDNIGKASSESPIKTRSPAELKEKQTTESLQTREEPERESPETNIFQHALERVEAARGVLKEARERVIPGSTGSLDDRKSLEEKVTPAARVAKKESLPTSERSDEVEKEGTPPPLPVRPIYTKPIPVSFPDKLHLSELDVDTLNVSEIQANKIKVSEIESTCIEVTELTSRGGNLTLNGIELPPDFISNIVAQVAAQQAQQSHTVLRTSRESTPQRQLRRVLTPPPSILVHASHAEVSLPEPKVPETDATEYIPPPKTTKSKGRKLQTRVIDDSEDELASTLAQRRDREQETKKKTEDKCETKQEEGAGPSLAKANSLELMGRLVSIWQGHAFQGARMFVQGVNSFFPEGEKRQDAQIAGVILLILITGLILLGFGFDNSIHHHHWDYFPPH